MAIYRVTASKGHMIVLALKQAGIEASLIDRAGGTRIITDAPDALDVIRRIDPAASISSGTNESQ